ncbi:MAG TPA: GAF domain-containing protein, partial [Casimicrobiaceae bacterium]|nr:GAF domain-containing protein [Casimicrobiaceae bacterium]
MRKPVVHVRHEGPLPRARELAWAGRHEQAIAIATSALDGLAQDESATGERMGLLDLRAESSIAVGRLDAADADAQAMVALASGASPARKVQAQNRRALVEMRKGKLHEAVATATSALRIARRIGDERLIAESLLRLGEAQMRAGNADGARKFGTEAAQRFASLADASGQGRALWVVANAGFLQNRADESRKAAQASLALCRSAGDRFGAGNASNALAFTQADLGENIRDLQRAAADFEGAGYIERTLVVRANLGLAYRELGLHRHALALERDVVEQSRRIGANVTLTYGLATSIVEAIELGEFDWAHARLPELEDLVQALDDPNMRVGLAGCRGFLAYAEGDYRAAVAHYRHCLKLSRAAGRGTEVRYLTRLGHAHLANGEIDAALNATRKATSLHRAAGFAKPDGIASHEIWWRHAQALAAKGRRDEAFTACERSYRLLCDSIATLRDEGLRRNYLDKADANRELVQAWIGYGTARKLPKERLTPHLSIESNPREPFQRLAAAGLRLNALRTAREIENFVVEEATELCGGERVVLVLERDGERAVASGIVPRGEDAKALLARLSSSLDDARRTHTAALSCSPRSASPLRQRWRIVAPLTAQNRLLGYLYADIDGLYGRFTDVDRDMLGMLANQAAIALDNAQWSEGLERKVAERTAELTASNASLAQRNDELAIINSIQQGLASELHFQAIVDLVGDKLREVFGKPNLGISWHDEKSNLMHYLYATNARGARLTVPSQPPRPGGIFETLRATRTPLLLNREDYGRINAPSPVPGGDESQCMLYVPIAVGDRVVGLIGIENFERANAFTDSDVRLVTTIAASLGTALENARLFDETQRLFKAEQERAAELSIINSIQQGLASKLDLQAIVDLVGEKLREILSSDDIGIRLYDDRTGLIHYLYEVEHGERLTMQPTKPSALFREQQRDRRPIYGPTADVAKRFSLSLFPGTDVSKAVANVPIVASDRVIGGISVESFEREDFFSESSIRLLQTIAASMGVALENARLFDETQRLFKSEQQRAAELAIINGVQAALAAELDIQGIYDAVGDRIGEIFGGCDVDIRIYDPHTNLIAFPYVREKGRRIVFETQPLPERGFGPHVIRTRETLVINERMEEEQEKYGSYTMPGSQSEKSALFVPLIVGDQARGLIHLMNGEREHAFSDSDVRLLQTLANSMSVALENARLFDETQRLLKETEQRNAELAIINSVQAALAAELDIQGIYDAVGDKIRDIFDGRDVGIRIYDPKTNLVHFPYIYEGGRRLDIPSTALADGFGRHVIRTRETLLINENIEEASARYGSFTIPGTADEKSALYVPLVIGDQGRGVISLIDLEREHAFSDSDVRLLQTLANSMSVALENARLFDETQRLLKETEQRNAELAIINSVQAALAAELNIQGIYDAVGDKIREIFGNRDVGIRVYDPKTDLLHYPYSYENGKRLTLESEALGRTGFTAHVMRTRETLVINEDMERTVASFGATLVPGTEMEKSAVYVPLVAGDQARGLICLVDMEREHAFSDSDVRLLQTLANSMSVALENARLFDETQRLLKETEQRNAELAIINSVQAALAAELNIQGIYDAVGDKIREIFGNRDIGIRVYDPDTDMVHYAYTYESGKRLFVPSEPLGTRGFTAHVMRTREPLVINEGMERLVEKFGSSVLPGTQLEKAAVFVPMIVGDQARGMISLGDYEREHAFSDSDLRLLQTLANSMSVALENARLFDETQRLLKETEQRNAELAIINSVQAALAAELDMQGIYDAVGNKVRDIFPQTDMSIRVYDARTRLVHYPYTYEGGERIAIEPHALESHGITAHVMRTREPLVINERMAQRLVELGSTTIPGTLTARSAVYVPLVVGEQVRGVLGLADMAREHVFGEPDVRLLTTVANTMSVALENARLFDETQRLFRAEQQRAAELAIINSVQQGLVSKLEIQAIYDLVGERLRELFDTQSISLASFDLARGTRHYHYMLERGRRFDVEDGPIAPLSRHIVRTREALVINDRVVERLAALGVEVRTLPGTQPTKSILRVPILVGNEVRGVIGIDNVDRENAFSDSDVRLLATLGSSMSVALENARLFEETTRLLQETEQRAAELTTVNTIGQAIASQLDLDALIRFVGDRMRQTFHADIVYVALVDKAAGLIRFPYAHGDEVTPLALGEGLTGRIVETAQPLLINSALDDATTSLGATSVGTEAKSYLGVPILQGAEAIGAISVQSTQHEGRFTRADQHLLATIAANVGVAIQNARL